MKLCAKWQQKFSNREGSKSEARNSVGTTARTVAKFETISNDQILNVPNKNSLGHLNFENSDLFRILIFGFRIFETPKTSLVLAMPG